MLRRIDLERKLARHCGLAAMGTGRNGDAAQLRRGGNEILTLGTEAKKKAPVYGHVDGGALAGHRLHLCCGTHFNAESSAVNWRMFVQSGLHRSCANSRILAKFCTRFPQGAGASLSGRIRSRNCSANFLPRIGLRPAEGAPPRTALRVPPT